MDAISDVTVVPDIMWPAFSGGVLVLLLVDLYFFSKGHHHMTKKLALVESAIWICLALCFNWWFGSVYGYELGMEFLTGYLVEKSLSVDNLFVILLIFSSFKIPKDYQHRILFFGVLGAIVFRAIFILIGAKLLHHFHWILYVFGGVLVFTAVKFLTETDSREDVQDNFAIKLVKKFMPTTTTCDTNRFFVVEDGVRKATPLFLALAVIELTDIIFAVDSIPAVFAVTQDAFVAFASNILAILGLRALYFVLADWVGKLKYLKPGLAAILGFIGIKMLIIDFYKIPSVISLLVIFAILTTAALSSWYAARVEERKRTREENDVF